MTTIFWYIYIPENSSHLKYLSLLQFSFLIKQHQQHLQNISCMLLLLTTSTALNEVQAKLIFSLASASTLDPYLATKVDK